MHQSGLVMSTRNLVTKQEKVFETQTQKEFHMIWSAQEQLRI